MRPAGPHMIASCLPTREESRERLSREAHVGS